MQVGLSLPNPKIDPSGPIEKVWKHLPRPRTKDSAIVVDRTNQADEKDITSTLIPQSTSKHHSRNSRNYQKSRGAPSSKGGSLNHTLEGKQLNFGHAFKYPMDKPLVFTASCADGASLTSWLMEIGLTRMMGSKWELWKCWTMEFQSYPRSNHH